MMASSPTASAPEATPVKVDEVSFAHGTQSPAPSASSASLSDAASSTPVASMVAAPVIEIAPGGDSTEIPSIDQCWKDCGEDPAAAAADEEGGGSSSSAGNILPLQKLARGWSVFSALASKTFEEKVKPAVAVAAEKTGAFYETTVKPAVAVAGERAGKAYEEQIVPAWEATKEKTGKVYEEQIVPAWEATKETTGKVYEESIKPAFNSAAEKTGEVYSQKVKPALDHCGEQCDLGVKKLLTLVNGKNGDTPVVGVAAEPASALDSSTKGSFTI